MNQETLNKIAAWAERTIYLDTRRYSTDKPEIVEIKEQGNAIYVQIKIKENVGEMDAK